MTFFLMNLYSFTIFMHGKERKKLQGADFYFILLNTVDCLSVLKVDEACFEFETRLQKIFEPLNNCAS